MPYPPERRVAPRIALRSPVEYRIGATQGSGLTWNISASGVRVERISAQVELDQRVELRASFFPGSFDTALMADVVRRTEGGFAAHFVEVGPDQEELLQRVVPQG